MSATLLNIKWCNFNFPDRTTSDVCTGNSDRIAKVDDPHLYWITPSCNRKREDERWDKGHQLDKHNWRWCHWRYHWLVYLQKVWFLLSTVLLPLTGARTVARAEQLEAEERNNGRHTTSEVPGAYVDDLNEQEATATLLQEDQIDFLDPEAGRSRYRDDFSHNDENDPFRHGDGTEEEGAINLGNHPSQR